MLKEEFEDIKDAMTRHIILIHERVIVVWGLFYLCHDKTHYFDSELTRVPSA
jgi:hypothetical protein